VAALANSASVASALLSAGCCSDALPSSALAYS